MVSSHPLIAANHAAHGTRPPLDVTEATGQIDFVTVSLDPRCIAYFRLAGGIIAEMWMTVDWNVWRRALLTGEVL